LVAAVFAAALVLGGAVAHAGTLGDYRLLVLDGARVKWGSPSLGTGAVVTYALASSHIHTDGAFNCADMDPVDALLAANHVRKDTFDAEVDAAFAAWESAANLSFIRIDDPASANIVIGAQMTPLGRSFTNVATRAGSAAPTTSHLISVGVEPGAITQSLICLNPDQAWKVGFDGDLAVYDLRYTLLHEIGHAIGLDHPDADKAVMDYHYTEAFSTLQPGDVAGAIALYGPRPPVATVAATPVSGSAGGIAAGINRK
jgi:hypothetical protein